jgi:peptidoglycan hydrolase-like protein with peptidoglycan-binding domain
MSRTLRAGDRGLDVYQWQAFLQGRGEPLQPVGAFDEPSVSATRRFQTARGLPQTGEADAATLGAARTLGLVLVDYWADDPGYPALPEFGPLTDNASRMALFGAFEFAPAPRPDNPEAIRFRDDWADRQLVTLELAQLRGLPGAPADARVRFHRRAAGALIGLWQAWDDAGLLGRIARFDGAFEPRFKRGRATQGELSAHAFGAAFDVNADWNALNQTPARPGQPGCLHELVPLANRFGFFWGGHFIRNRDGMHFEVAHVE